jgi:hypothetical protein
VTGIGFRVIANGYNYYSIAARNPTEPATFTSVDSHLSWRHNRTPWVSVYWTWFAALRRAKWYTEKGCRDVVIVVIDLEKMRMSRLSAPAFKAHLSGFVPQWHAYELLIHQGINEDAVVACIPVAGDQVDVEVHLARIRVPRSLVNLIAELTEDVIRGWVRNEIYSRTGVWNEETTLRVMQSMCVKVRDDLSVL